MRPSLDSLACFVAAAHTLNFRAASRTCGLTPAALGKRIAQLEDELGEVLFHRTTRRVELSDAGRALLPHAKRLLELAEACVHVAQGGVGRAPLELSLGTRHELGMSWILPVRDRLLEVLPHVTLHLYFGAATDLERQVLNLALDCAVSSKRPSTNRIASLNLHREDYALVAAPSLLASRPLASAADAVEHTLVDIDESLPLFSYWRSSTELRFRDVLRMGTIAAIRHRVLAGEGVAVLPLYFVRPDLEAGRLARLFPDSELAHDYFRLIFRNDDARRDTFERIAEVMRAAPLR